MTSYFKIGFLQILNILAFVAMVLVNGLADFLPINGQTTGAISDQYPNLFVPAPITFSIWAVIYSLLFLFCIYQGSTLFESEKRYTDKKERIVEKIGYGFLLSCVLNIAWILAWHYHLLLLSVLIMLGLLVTLAIIVEKLYARAEYTGQEKWFVYVPFSIYLGWISIATIANITAYLVSIGWNGWGLDPAAWACIMIIAGTTLGVMVLFRKNNIFFTIALIWAFIGIAIKQHDASNGFNRIALTALGGALLLLLLAVLKMKKLRPVQKQVV
ncbi:MAG: hypothetical protein WCF67_21320 [Chitinophagaceae bacterium]